MLHARSDYNGRVVDLAGLIPEDEPVFLLRGQDMLAGAVVRFWANQARHHGASEAVYSAALRHASKMDSWPTHKLVDVPESVGLDGEPGDEYSKSPGDEYAELQVPDFYQPSFDKLELEKLLQGIDEGTLLSSDDPLIAKVRAMLATTTPDVPLDFTLTEPEEKTEETPPQTPEISDPEG